MNRTKAGFLITQVKQLGSRKFERILAEQQIDAFNGAQGRILYVLWQQDDIPIIELSNKTALAKTTLTSMLDRMESVQLIKRIYDTKDRRKIRIALTEKAKGLKKQYDAVSNEMNEIYFQGFTDSEITAFEAYLERIILNLSGGKENE